MANVIKWKRLSEEVVIPTKAHPTDAGMDMRVIVHKEGDFAPKSVQDQPVISRTVWDPDLGTSNEAVLIMPNQSIKFHTGLKCAIPEGYYLEVHPRSSLGFKKEIMIANTVGIIDAHYRGELIVALHNNSIVPQVIENGERVVQCMLKKVEDVENIEVDELDETDRGEGGFGSSGTK